VRHIKEPSLLKATSAKLCSLVTDNGDSRKKTEKLLLRLYRGMDIESMETCVSLQCIINVFLIIIINVFLIIRQNVNVIWPVKRYKAQILYYVNTYRFTYTATCIQCWLDTLLNCHLNIPFWFTRKDKITNSNQSHKSYRKYKSENGRIRTSEYIRGLLILNTNKRCLVFSMSSFELNIIFSSMLSMC
jgi:hypothetical protein